MIVDRKYYKNNTVHKTILCTDDTANNIISCGFLHKQGKSCLQNNILFKYYGGLFVISGTGEYIDGVTGERYPVYPGCVVQRMPGKLHHDIIKDDGEWLEFYFCAGEKVFDMLVKMGMITGSPVFYVGDSIEIFNMLLQYMDKVKNTNEHDTTNLIFEFQKLLYLLNTYKESNNYDDTMLLICEKLKSNYKIGTKLTDIAKEFSIGYESMRKQFKKKFGCSISQYRTNLRINASKTMLLDKHMSVKSVALELGYYDEYAFSNQFKNQVGMSPSKFIKMWGD